ncbi:hypothetical protein BJ878DRAFT_494642 [Calycina marina]|uniref:Uncharacterized protein n=1 Tax=Calycina marina TaxID=1763456 RepID=A0A9P7Z816_9HELO|nr:hypothetical protein BJ878DRAFT_494642 [Calycina marina]
MARRTQLHAISSVLSIRTLPSATGASIIAATTPVSSAYPSAYPSEAEEDDDEDVRGRKRKKAFPFLSLPSELRNNTYSLVFSTAPAVMDLDPDTFWQLHRYKTLALFSVSRQVHSESTHHFFSTHTFRIFPTHPGRYFKTEKPLLARLPAHYRSCITNLELRLGPGFNAPPRGWVVNEALGLGDCVNVRILKVFVQCDPSDGFFKGFRAGEGFYEKCCQDWLEGVIDGIPTIGTVEFDAYTSVMQSGDMMQGLGRVVSKFGKVVGWGPERGWDKENDNAWLDALLTSGGAAVSKSVAIFA